MITEKELIEAFSECVDPELSIDVWTLGLIYNHEITKDNTVKILMTFTSPLCPYGPQIVEDLEKAIKEKGAQKVEVEITFDPPWQPSDELRDMLGV